jgi:hypothetical protein
VSSSSELWGRTVPYSLNRKRTLIVIGLAGLVSIGIVILLVTGSEPTPLVADGRDARYVEGKSYAGSGDGRLAASIADLKNASLARDGSEVVFNATVFAPIPARLEGAALEFRWDLTGPDGRTWIVTGLIDKHTDASVQDASGGFGAGTVDGTLRGRLTTNGQTVELRFDASSIDGFPSEFDWKLSSTLVAFRNHSDSPRVEDSYPNEGVVRFSD